MKQVIVVGNWKSNKTVQEAQSWLKTFAQKYSVIDHSQVSVVLCVPFTLLYPLGRALAQESFSLFLGSQTVSSFGQGAYTGEVSADMVQGLAEYVIIGHTERRKYFYETDVDLAQKVINAKKAGLQVIYCVNDEQMPVPAGVDIVSYEPAWAIGTGKPDTPEHVNEVMDTIKKITGVAKAIYGGSVNQENVATYIAQANVDGVLPGGASLDPEKFAALIAAASAV